MINYKTHLHAAVTKHSPGTLKSERKAALGAVGHGSLSEFTFQVQDDLAHLTSLPLANKSLFVNQLLNSYVSLPFIVRTGRYFPTVICMEAAHGSEIRGLLP